jgi:tellurite resistance protein TehA-like permease
MAGRQVITGVLARSARGVVPGCFAMIMATGIVSAALRQERVALLPTALLAIAVAGMALLSGPGRDHRPGGHVLGPGHRADSAAGRRDRRAVPAQAGPHRYRPDLWTVVFPLGMYATAGPQLGTAAMLPLIHHIGEKYISWYEVILMVSRPGFRR